MSTLARALQAALARVAGGGDFRASARVALDTGARAAFVVSRLSQEYAETAHAEERALVARAVTRRQRQFFAGRWCAREAAALLDLPNGPILSGAGGQPLWPGGMTGSISHCQDLACAMVLEGRSGGVGIDLERLDAQAAELDWDLVLSRRERGRLASRNLPCILAFSAKEAFYKFIFPSIGRFVDFRDVEVDPGDVDGRFSIRITARRGSPLRPGARYEGSVVRCAGHLLTCLIR